jgi:hypothetical protein
LAGVSVVLVLVEGAVVDDLVVGVGVEGAEIMLLVVVGVVGALTCKQIS